MSPDLAHQLWRQAGLQLPRRRPRRKIVTSRPRPLPSTGIVHIGSYDFVFDSCANGQQLKCLTMLDEYSRECLAIDVAGVIRSGRAIDVLTPLISVRDAPRYIGSDNGAEFVVRAILRWFGQASNETAYIDSGKPWQNLAGKASMASSETSA